MSYKQLKAMLLIYKGKNHSMELAIRTRMRELYKIYMQRQVKKRQSKKETEQLVMDLINEVEKTSSQPEPLTPGNKQCGSRNASRGYGSAPSMRASNIEEVKPMDQYQRQIKNDHLNNNLMKRMNGEMEIRKNKPMEYSMIPPYSNTAGNMYASWNRNNDIRNFSSLNILENKPL